MPIRTGASRAKNGSTACRPQAAHENRPLLGVDPMQLKNTLGRIHANANKLFHGRLPCLRLQRLTLAHHDAVGRRPPQHSVICAIGQQTELSELGPQRYGMDAGQPSASGMTRVGCRVSFTAAAPRYPLR
jgi:hypothetical protein